MGCVSVKKRHSENKLYAGNSSRRPSRSAYSSLYRSETISTQESIHNVYNLGSEIIGLGHYGQVRIATLISNPQKKFAVKTIAKDRTTKDFHLLNSEIEIFRELDHPNIVKFYETYQDDRSFHIVMEYCSGGELLERMTNQGGFDEQECSVIMEKAFSAVKYLHERGIVHRDIKPENFLFASQDPDAEIKLIDFGLSKRLTDPNEQLHSKLGTPLYVAPEVLRGQYDYRADYWSLGVTMYIILSGRFPFDEETTAELCSKIIAGKYSFAGEEWKAISKKAKNLISKLLVTDPRKRYTAQQALEHPWIKDRLPPPSEVKATSMIIQNLKQFRTIQKFKKEVLNILVTFLSEKEIKKLTEAFRYCDRGNTGEITVDDLKRVLKESHFGSTQQEIDKILEELGINDQDTIRYSEFLAATMDSKLYLSKETIWTAFKFFDIDNSNAITVENVQEVMKRAGKNYSDNEIRAMVQEVDFRKGGKISFEEFCQMLGLETLQKEVNMKLEEQKLTSLGDVVLRRSTSSSPEKAIISIRCVDEKVV